MGAYDHIPIIGQPKAKLAVGFGMILNDEQIKQCRRHLENANAENKVEVLVQYNDQVAAFTFDAFFALVFPQPPLVENVDSGSDPA